MNPRPFDLVIFDCDGVHVDREPITNRIFADMLRELGLNLSKEEVYERFLGRTMSDCVDLVSAQLGRALPSDFVERYHARTKVALEAELKCVAGVAGVIESMQLPFCVASSGEHEKMRTTLGITGLLPHFEGKLFSATEVAKGKPAPDLFMHAAARSGVAPSRCLVIEDSPAGVKAGIAAGMTVFGYAALTKPDVLRDAGAHRVFSSMSELPALIDAAGGER